MPLRYNAFTDSHYAYFATLTIVDWIPIFQEGEYRQIVLDSLNYLRDNKHIKLNVFVVMPTHLHTVLWPDDGVKLSDVVRDFKRPEKWLYSSARAYLLGEITYPPTDILSL